MTHIFESLIMDLIDLRREVREIHNACWYDAGGVSGTYDCDDCRYEKELRGKIIVIENQIKELLHGDF